MTEELMVTDLDSGPYRRLQEDCTEPLQEDRCVEVWFRLRGKKGLLRGKIKHLSLKTQRVEIKMYGKFKVFVLKTVLKDVRLQSWSVTAYSIMNEVSKKGQQKAWREMHSLFTSNKCEFDISEGIMVTNLSKKNLSQLPKNYVLLSL